MNQHLLESTNYVEILYQLKSTVEGLLDSKSTNVWNVYGGLNRLHSVVAKIFKHGFRIYKPNGDADCWIFIQGLSWLQPTLAASPTFVGSHMTQLKSPIRNYDKAMTWLNKSIENHTLSEKLCWLLSDQEHLVSCYYPTAYLRQPRYSEATLICLKAVEQNLLSLLADIDPSLYLRKKILHKVHRRTQSFPDNKGNDSNTTGSFANSSQSKYGSFAENRKNFPCRNLPITRTNSDGNSSGPSAEKIFNLEVLESVFKPTDDEMEMKRFIRKQLLKRNFSTSDLRYIRNDPKFVNKFVRLYKGKKCHSLNYITGVGHGKIQTGTNLSDILKVDYGRYIKRKNSIDSSFSSSGSVNTLICDGNNKKSANKANYKRKRRRSSIFKLPFRIWEETSSDDTQSVCSDGSRTLVPGCIQNLTDSTISIPKRKSFIEDNGNIVLPMSIGFFPKPSPGQSLISFLSSGIFTQATAELDRENAHFSISEAMIATIEQVKCNNKLNNADEMVEESDEEINELKRSIRIRRRQKQEEKQLHSDSAFFSSETNDSIATDHSADTLSSSTYCTSDSISTDTECDNDAEEKRNLLTTKQSGLSVSKLALYSDAPQTNESAAVSAESVAISLLRRFNEDQLPAASEIEWLVSEHEAPQKILPLPRRIDPFSNSVKEEEDNTLLRGTFDWAPPRPQIIFTPHPPPIRKILMEKQKYRCAGCSMKVEYKYACKFRYCEYLGRYFCTDCHAVKTYVIPGKIIFKWDFSKYPVSNFSYSLLDQMLTDPLFNINDLNPTLYEKNGTMKKIRLLRFQISYLKDFIFSCKYTDKLKLLLEKEQTHIISEPDCYSLQDLIQVKNGKLFSSLLQIVRSSIKHVNSCQFCQVHGFICEICNNNKVIFPWNLEHVTRCTKCGSCYHTKCFTSVRICRKCLRRSNRYDRWDNLSALDCTC